MKQAAVVICTAILAGAIGLGTLSATPDAASGPRPAILCPPAC
jgi:hypothetical protein